MNIHSLTFDIHFCFAIDLSLKKKPQWNICWNPFQFKNNCHTKLEPKLYIYTPYIHSIHIMALQLAQLYKIYTSQRIFTSDMFWYGVRATCYPRYKFKHHTLSFSLFNPLSLSLSYHTSIKKSHSKKGSTLLTRYPFAFTLYKFTSVQVALDHLLLQYMLSCLLIILVSHICFGIMAHG